MGDVGDRHPEPNVFYPSHPHRVARGTTVAWVWKNAGHAMQIRGQLPPRQQILQQRVQSPGYQMTHTFDTAGTYNYCTTHCGPVREGPCHRAK
ncbi:MAG: hypothetical protein IPL96_16830 [Holophagaceae bacterium]|nr:hypothetical protein [Holophagaceae bacterium]